MFLGRIDIFRNKVLIKNFMYLSILQILNYLLPFILFPYLVRVLGVYYFGLLAFAMATVQYFNILIDYGFNLTATKEISIYKNNKVKIENIFSEVIITKLVLIFLSLILLTILIFSIHKFSQYWYIFYLSFCVIIGQNLLPLWFFQGIEEMKYITIFNVTAKIFFTIMIFIFVKDKNDFYLVPVLNSLGYIVVGLYSLYYINKKFNIKISFKGIQKIKQKLFLNFQIFISNIGITFYSISTTFLLGLFTNNTIVGNYAIVEKLILAMRQLYAPFNQSIYPYFMKRFYENKKKAFIMLNKIAISVSIFLFIISIILFLYSKEILFFIFGKQSVNAEILYFFKILIFVPIFTFLGSLYLMNAMIALKLHYLRNKIIFFVGISYFILMVLILNTTKFLLFPYLYLGAEILISLLSFLFTFKYIKGNI